MPHDRRTGRLLLAMTGMVGVALSVGCMRASNLRSTASALPDLTPAGALHLDGIEAAPTTTTRGASSWAQPAARPDRGPRASDPVEAEGRGDATPAPPDERPAPTPLLDAQIRRVQAVNREHIASLAAAEEPAQPPPSAPTAAPPELPPSSAPPPSPSGLEPPPVEPGPVDRDVEAIAPLPLSSTSHREDVPEASPSPAGIAVPPLIPIDPAPVTVAPATIPTPTEPKDEAPDPAVAIARGPEVEPSPDAEPAPDAGPAPAPAPGEAPAPDAPEAEAPRPAAADAGHPDRDGRPPLEIAAMRLCSRVQKFGLFEPIDADSIRPGQRARLYCEMDGLEYQPRDALFISRLAARIELRRGEDGPVVWEQAAGIARDESPRPRRDYYVSYLIAFPEGLEPGPYRLRLIQTDLIGRGEAAREIPLTIVR